MWFLLLSIALAGEPAGEAPATSDAPSYREIVFDDIPPKKQRLKLIRKAFRSPTLHGGKDWGRVVCFVYHGPVPPGSLERALQKAKLRGIIRETDGCDEPPVEAFIPPEPVAVRRLTLFEPFEPLVLRKAFDYLLQGDHGVSGFHIAPERSDRLCLELERELDDLELRTLLEAAPIRVVELERVASCAEALQP